MNVGSILPLAPSATRGTAAADAPPGFLERLAAQLGGVGGPVAPAGRDLPTDRDTDTGADADATGGADVADDADPRATLLAHVSIGRLPSVTLPVDRLVGTGAVVEAAADPSDAPGADEPSLTGHRADLPSTTTAGAAVVAGTGIGADGALDEGPLTPTADHAAATPTGGHAAHGDIATQPPSGDPTAAGRSTVAAPGASTAAGAPAAGAPAAGADPGSANPGSPITEAAGDPDAHARPEAATDVRRATDRAPLTGRDGAGVTARTRADVAPTTRAEGGEVASAATTSVGAPAGNAPEPTSRLGLPSTAAQRVLDIVSQLEDAPPPRVIVIETGELRVRVGLDAGVVRLTVLGETTEAGEDALQEAADALANEGFETELDRPSGGPADGERERPTDARPSTADVADGAADRDRSSTRPRAGLQL